MLEFTSPSSEPRLALCYSLTLNGPTLPIGKFGGLDQQTTYTGPLTNERCRSNAIATTHSLAPGRLQKAGKTPGNRKA